MDKEKLAIERIKAASKMSMTVYGKPLIITTSGGKDSSVCVALAVAAGIPFEVMHNHTTIDAPETVRFIQSEFARLENRGIQCTKNMPTYKGQRTSMWDLILKKLIPPTRIKRYCCEVLKERGGVGRFIVTGVRWAESKKRENGRGIYERNHKEPEKRIILANDNDEKRLLFENCRLKAKRTCNPIIDWQDADVWDYIESEHIPVNPLYQCGFSRIGCVGCPLASTRTRQFEFAKYPKYKQAYIRTFGKMIEERKRRGLPVARENAVDEFHWWMEDGVLPGQLFLDTEEMGEWD